MMIGVVVLLSAAVLSMAADQPMRAGVEPYSVVGGVSKKRQAGICENPAFESCDATLVR
jgi:hypothetical protein